IVLTSVLRLHLRWGQGLHRGLTFLSCAFLGAAVGSLFNDPEELLHIERLREISARAGGHKSFDLARSSIRADDHDRYVAGGVIELEAREDLPTRQIGKEQVEQDDIERVLARDIVPKIAFHCSGAMWRYI